MRRIVFLSITDRLGRVTTRQVDAIRELLQTTDPMGRTTRYTWCTCGGLATPGVGFTYDTVYNRVTSMVEGTGGTGTTSYSYNSINALVGAGRLSSVSVPIASTTATVTYSYDELGRVTERDVDHATIDLNDVATTFDALGRVTGVTNALGAFTYAYVNETSRLSSVTYPSGTGLSTSYSYFDNTHLQDFERLKTIQNFKSSGATNVSKFDYTYNAVGTIATWTQQADSSTAVVNTLTYDNAAQSGGGSASNAYKYDPAGNRLTETTASTTTAGAFNNLNQLTALTSSAATQTVAGHTDTVPASTLSIDSVPASITSTTNFTANVSVPAGTNIVSIVATPSTGPATTKRYQIVTTGTTPTTLTYDANGNVHTDENGNTYQWDALNRLIKITYSGGATSNFAYDGLSRRVSIIEKNSGGTVTSTKLYIWVGSEIAEERASNGTTVTKRFFPQGEQQSGTAYYYFRDHLGSTRELLDGSGTLLTRYTYDPYGRTTTTYVSGTHDATFQWAGMMRHQASNLYMTRNVPGLDGREYNTDTGDWISRDAAGERGGVNLYGYCGDNPILYRDTFGLACGVVLKQLYPNYFRKDDLVGHEWLEWPGGSAGFWPGGNGVGLCSPSAPPLNEVPDEIAGSDDAKTALSWATEKVDTGELQAGPDKGTKCCKATCAQILKCLMVFQITQQYNLYTHNCYGGASDRLNACCLTKSNMMAQHGGRGKNQPAPGN